MKFSIYNNTHIIVDNNLSSSVLRAFFLIKKKNIMIQILVQSLWVKLPIEYRKFLDTLQSLCLYKRLSYFRLNQWHAQKIGYE